MESYFSQWVIPCYHYFDSRIVTNWPGEPFPAMCFWRVSSILWSLFLWYNKTSCFFRLNLYFPWPRSRTIHFPKELVDMFFVGGPYWFVLLSFTHSTGYIHSGFPPVQSASVQGAARDIYVWKYVWSLTTFPSY